MPVESIAIPRNGNLKFTGYQRERGSRAQLDLDGLVRPWHHRQARAGPAVQTAYHDRCTPTPSRRCAKEGGPSAGVAMVYAIVSLLMDMYVPPTTAMTGEITLRDQRKGVGRTPTGANRVILPLGKSEGH
ncbi:hypothetical protein BGY98DRAFT_1190803 [Russula aff. rugulosa BPL654]|nr:hypothetical protein BGY98DRAFT_1190803 [Russula aff. rugulosa BPL654]